MHTVIRLCLLSALILGCEKAPRGASQSSEVSLLQEQQRESARAYMNAERAADTPAPAAQPKPKTAQEPTTEAPVKRPPPPRAQGGKPQNAAPRMTKAEQRRHEILTSAAQLSENGLLTMEALLKAHRPGSHWKAISPYLEQSASYTNMKRRAHWRVSQTSDWRELKKLIKAPLARYSRKRAKRRAAVEDILAAGVDMVSRKDGYERATGYALINECLEQLGDKLNSSEKTKYLSTILSQYNVANEIHERLLMLKVLGAHADRRLDRFLLRVVLEDSEWTARREALLGVDNCLKLGRGCSIDLEGAELIYDTYADSRTRGPLFQLAGRAQLPVVTQWCLAHLHKGNLAQSCRSALSLVRTREAFDALHDWLNARKDEPSSVAVGQYTFRDEFQAITPYADFHYAKERYYTLLFNVLGQDIREPHATGGIVRTMGQLKDSKRALYIVESILAFYEAKWEKLVRQRGHKFLFKQLHDMRRLLASRERARKRSKRR